MPKTLTVGDGGPDVVLLQNRLSARPTALPPLAVDGEFGPVTLQRVKEFQVNEFANGIVEAATWERLLDGPPDAKKNFFTQGRHLFDPMGNKVVLRGVNKMSVWDLDDPTGEVYFPEIRKTGANSVRIVWKIVDDDGAPTDIARLDALITNARSNRLVPMIELHDATSNWSGLEQLVACWIRLDVVALIQKHQAYLLVNIGNEVGDDTVSSGDFITGYTSAVTTMRGAGIHTLLVIDAADSGKRLEILNASAATLIAADPDHNLLFSVHTYWAKSCGADAQFIRSQLETAVSLGYPLIVGEFSKVAGEPCIGGASKCGLHGEIDYQTILQVCQEKEIGWYAWEWGPGNSRVENRDPLCDVMEMTPDGMFDNLNPGWAEEVAVSGPFSLKKASVTILGRPAAPIP